MVNRQHDNPISEHFIQRLDLGADPFSAGFRSNFFYQGAGRRRLLDQLVHYVRFSQQPLLLCSEKGSGKSYLVNELISQLQPIMDCCRISVENLHDTKSLLQAMAISLELKLDDECSSDSFIDALRFTLAEGQEPEPTLVVIEKVDLLTAEELHFLLSIQAQSLGAVHYLWCSDKHVKSFDEIIGEAGDGLKSLTVNPLSERETSEYLLACLQEVGYAGEDPLTKNELEALHQKAEGNLGKIKEMAPGFLNSQNKSNSGRVKIAIPITHVAAIAILASALIVAYLYQGEAEKKEISELSRKSIVVKSDTASEMSNEIELSSKLEAAISEIDKTDNAAESLKVDETIEAAVPVINNDLVDSSNLIDADSTVISESGEIDGNEDEVIFETPETPLVDKQIDAELNEPTGNGVSEHGFTPKEQRILGLKSQSYMLQLLGSRSEQSAKDFVKRYVAQIPVTYIKAELKDKPWYIVLSGPYANRKEALNAVKYFPQDVQKLKPWARPIEGIQENIKKRTAN